MRVIMFVGLGLAITFASANAFAQESEFKAKIKEDLDGYKERIESSCGVKLKAIEWSGGKLGHNPRESEKPEWNGISTLCTSAADALTQACVANEPVKKAMSKLTKVECVKGKGTIAYKLKGSTITFTIDPSFTANNPAGQT